MRQEGTERMDRPKMDRPRERKGTPFSRELTRLLKVGLLIVGVVLVVGALPVVFLWFYADDIDPGSANLAFRDEEIAIPSGDIELGARLRLPPYDGPHPALVVAHGSGKATRDRYDDLARDLALNGYALLTYDKRGVGESGGTYVDVAPDNSAEVFDELSDDVLAGVRYLRTRADIVADRIGVLGVSQGGWIAPLAAAKSDDVSFLVIISGPAVTVGEEIYYSGLTGEKEGADAAPDEAELSAKLAAFDGARGFDPVPYLERIDVPALWVLGDADRSIPVPETVAVLHRLEDEGKPFTIQLLPGVGHAMHDVSTGQPAPVFPLIFRWLVRNVAPPNV